MEIEEFDWFWYQIFPKFHEDFGWCGILVQIICRRNFGCPQNLLPSFWKTYQQFGILFHWIASEFLQMHLSTHWKVLIEIFSFIIWSFILPLYTTQQRILLLYVRFSAISLIEISIFLMIWLQFFYFFEKKKQNQKKPKPEAVGLPWFQFLFLPKFILKHILKTLSHISDSCRNNLVPAIF